MFQLILSLISDCLYQILPVSSLPLQGKVDTGRLTEDRWTDEVRQRKAFGVIPLTRSNAHRAPFGGAAGVWVPAGEKPPFYSRVSAMLPMWMAPMRSAPPMARVLPSLDSAMLDRTLEAEQQSM